MRALPKALHVDEFLFRYRSLLHFANISNAVGGRLKSCCCDDDDDGNLMFHELELKRELFF
jgi:hypothetical protein